LPERIKIRRDKVERIMRRRRRGSLDSVKRNGKNRSRKYDPADTAAGTRTERCT